MSFALREPQRFPGPMDDSQPMDLSKPSTETNLETAFGGESMANRKYLSWPSCFATPPPRKPSTPFEAIPDDWHCPICGASKASFVPYCAS